MATEFDKLVLNGEFGKVTIKFGIWKHTCYIAYRIEEIYSIKMNKLDMI